MDMSGWAAGGELLKIYEAARELGLETNIAELEAFGFTVVPPEKVAPASVTEGLKRAALTIAEREALEDVELNKRSDRPAYGRQLFHLLAKDAVFAEAIVNPSVLAMARYLVGASCRLYSLVAFLKEGPAGVTHLHSDSTGVPAPLPFYGNVCNVSWALTDYTVENGTFFMVPGSHRFCRHPSPADLPQVMGGAASNDTGVPVIAEAGSLIVFHGNTWHGTYPKASDEVRVHLAHAFCRNYVNPAEDFSDLSPEIVEAGGPEFARLIGAEAWQGYGGEGPRYERMLKVRNAMFSQFA